MIDDNRTMCIIGDVRAETKGSTMGDGATEQPLGKAEYKERMRPLQERMFALERSLLESHMPVLLVFEGWAGTSKIGMIGRLTSKMDPRGLRVHPITPPRTYERQYPWLYRFWLKTPTYGQMALFDRSWYRQVLSQRTRNGIDDGEWRSRIDDIVGFERLLADDGALILKFLFQISQKEQKKRLDALADDPLTAWQVTDDDRWQNRHYDKVEAAMNEMLNATDAACAPWLRIDASDERAATLQVFQSVIQHLEARLGTPADEQGELGGEYFDSVSATFHRPVVEPTPTSPAAAPDASSLYSSGLLSQVDLGKKLEGDSYSPTLARLQAAMYMLGLEVYRQDRPVVLVFEGWDAAGKGGSIKRLTEKLDPRAYVVHAIAAPSGDDRQHHYLYRFWRRLPECGQIGIFDRSWYGRVLVERVEGFARPDEWQRAYSEINEFERQLISFGTIICKFWMHISPEEQLRRFEERQNVSYKAWKLTDEDWRNREKWPQYEHATNDMLWRTSTPAAPWTVVEANDKRFARIKVMQTVVKRLEDEFGPVVLPTKRSKHKGDKNDKDSKND